MDARQTNKSWNYGKEKQKELPKSKAIVVNKKESFEKYMDIEGTPLAVIKTKNDEYVLACGLQIVDERAYKTPDEAVNRAIETDWAAIGTWLIQILKYNYNITIKNE